MSLANGKYITFLDDDDIYLPGRLDTMLLHMKQNKYIIISSGRFVECDNFKSIVLQENQIFGEFNFKKIQFGNDIDIGFMMRKDAFINLGGFDITLRALEDWDFILRALKLGDGFKIHRFDYVVNRTEGAARVSLGEAQGYLELLKKWQVELVGDKNWIAFMISTSLRLNRKLTLKKSLFYFFKYRSFIPLKQYFSAKIKNA